MEMFNSPKHQLTAKQKRNAVRIPIVITIMMFVTIILFWFTFGAPAPTILAPIYLFAMIGVVSLVGSFLAKRGNHLLGVAMVIASIQIAVLLLAYQTSGISVLLSMVCLVLTLAIANAALPETFVTRSVIASIVVSLIVILLDIFEPFPRQTILNANVTWGIGAALILIYGILVLRQFPTYRLRTKVLVRLPFIFKPLQHNCKLKTLVVN